MKRFTLIVAVLLIAAAAFAGAPKEQGTELTVLSAYPEDSPAMAAVERFRADHPDVTVTILTLDLSDGSTMTMDALLASGQAPNVYDDYIGRISKYIDPDFALPLDGKIDGLDKFVGLGGYRRNGALLGLPKPGGAQGMAINMDLMREIGYEVPDFGWTVADFLEMAEMVKQHYGGEKWATGMFAANQSGDYLINQWFASFGVDFYQGDYTETTIRETGGARVYEFFQTLVREGYIPPNADTLTDDDFAPSWARGELAATAFFPSWHKPYFEVVAQQGYEPFEVKYVPFPTLTGEPAPTYISNAAIVVRETGDASVDTLAAKLASYLVSAETQEQETLTSVLPTRTDARVLVDNPHIEQTARIVAEAGIWDSGLTTRYFTPRRPLHFPILQRVLRLELTPAEAIKQYEAALNSVQ